MSDHEPTRRLRPQGEEGIALVLAVVMLAVLSIMVASALTYTNSTSRDAARGRSGQQAYALAEAGINNALAQLGSHYPSSTYGTSSWVTSVDATHPDGQWGYAGGTVSWSGSLSTKTPTGGTWTLTATGKTASPTGTPGSKITRTVTAKIDVIWDTQRASLWNWVYSGSDTTITNSGSFAVPIWVNGNLTLSNTGEIIQPATLVVGGNLTLSQAQTSVGSLIAPLSEAHVVGWCKYKLVTTTPCQANTAVTNVWATTFNNALPSPPLPSPVMQASDWQDRYALSSSTAGSCSSTGSSPGVLESSGNSVLDNSAGTFDLTPSGSTYSCTTASGSLSWNGSTLTMNGVIYIDGNVQVTTPNNTPALYTGLANIFATGTITFQINSALCAKLTSTGKACDTTYGAWDPANAMLIMAAYNSPNTTGNAVSVKGASYQGGLYGQTNIDIQNSSNVQGPLVSATTITDAQQGAARFPASQTLAPAYPLDKYTLGKLYGNSG